MNDFFHDVMRGLILHYLNQGTVEQAIEQGREAGVPAELLDSLPGMMFEITAAAGAIVAGGRAVDEVAEELLKRAEDRGNVVDFDRSDATAFLRFAVDFLNSLGNDDDPLPALTGPWYMYGQQEVEGDAADRAS